MINQDKWINSLPKTNIKFNEEENQVDHSRWVNTIPKKILIIMLLLIIVCMEILLGGCFICLRFIICICHKK